MKPDFSVDFPGLGIQDLPVSRVAFTIFGLPIYWYGMLIALAIVICILLAMRRAPAFLLTADDVLDTFIALIPLMIVFARLYYVVFSWDLFKSDWKLVFDTRQGGLAFYGGVIGGIIGIILVTRLKKIPVSRLIDFLVVYVPLGQAIGRWGNFFNQEAFGNNTHWPWGMYSESVSGTSSGTFEYLTYVLANNPSFQLVPGNPVHPTFLYEFIANMLIFFILLRIRRTNKTPFAVMLWYFILYGFIRFFVEGIRTDPLLIGTTSLRISQLLSALMVIASAILLIILNRRRQQQELTAALVENVTPPAGDGSSESAAFIEFTDQPVFVAIDEIESTENNKLHTEPALSDKDAPAGQKPPDDDLSGQP